jgi:hypothetical protein
LADLVNGPKLPGAGMAKSSMLPLRWQMTWLTTARGTGVPPVSFRVAVAAATARAGVRTDARSLANPIAVDAKALSFLSFVRGACCAALCDRNIPRIDSTAAASADACFSHLIPPGPALTSGGQ